MVLFHPDPLNIKKFLAGIDAAFNNLVNKDFMDLIKRWKNVLEKCQEIPPEKWLKAAEEMERHLPHLLSVDKIINFTMETLPKIRKSFSK